MITIGLKGFIAGIILTAVAAVAGAYIDSYIRSTVVMYDLEDDTNSAFQTLTNPSYSPDRVYRGGERSLTL